MEGLIEVYKKAKYKLGEDVYFNDWLTNPVHPTIRKGKIIKANNTETCVIGGEVDLIITNLYEIESEGKVYKVNEGFISKNKKKLEH